MAKFEVTAPDGKRYEVTAPEGASESDILSYVQAQISQAQQTASLRPAPPMSPAGAAAEQALMGGGLQRATMGMQPERIPQPGLREQGARLAKTNPVAVGFMNAAQGPLFNFADNVSAAGASVVDMATGRNPGMGFQDLYPRYLDVARGAQEQYQRDRPVLAPAGQIAASLPFVGIARGVEKALPVAAGALGVARNAAITGGLFGALSGAGEAESVDEMPGKAALGATSGAVTSGVLSGTGAVARGVKDRVVAAFGGKRTAEDLARSRLATALTRDENTAKQVADELRRLGPDARLATGAGMNTSQLLDTMATAPGRTANLAEQAIREQQRSRPERLVGAARDFMSVGPRRFVETVDDFAAQRAQAAAPLYKQLQRMTIDADDELTSLVRRAQSQGADRVGRSIAETRGVPFTLEPIAAGQRGVRIGMGDADYMKEGLDDLIRKQTDAAGNVSRQGVALIELRRDLLTKLDTMTRNSRGESLYKSARDAYAGPSALIDAAEAGRRVMRMDGISIGLRTRDMSDSELRAFRIGAFESIRDQIGTDGGQTQLMKLWKEPKIREKLQAVAPSLRTYQEFAEIVLGEGKKKSLLEGVGRGAATAGRNARLDDEGSAALSAMTDAASALSSSGPGGFINSARNLYGRLVMPEPVRDRIGEMLLTRGPEAQGLLGDLSRYVDAEAAARAARASRMGLLGGVGANSSITSLLQ